MAPNDRLKICDVGNRELLGAEEMKLEERNGAICKRRPGRGRAGCKQNASTGLGAGTCEACCLGHMKLLTHVWLA